MDKTKKKTIRFHDSAMPVDLHTRAKVAAAGLKIPLYQFVRDAIKAWLERTDRD